MSLPPGSYFLLQAFKEPSPTPVVLSKRLCEDCVEDRVMETLVYLETSLYVILEEKHGTVAPDLTDAEPIALRQFGSAVKGLWKIHDGVVVEWFNSDAVRTSLFELAATLLSERLMDAKR